MMTPQEMRAEAIQFLSANGGRAERSILKKHLGLDDWKHSPIFEQAMKTVKIQPIYGDGYIGSGLYLSRRPIVAFELAR